MPEAEAGPGHTVILLQETMTMSREAQASREELESLKRCLSADRMSKYIRADTGSLSNALALYNWNTAVSAAFYGPLQWLEVTLRNSIDHCLAETYGDAWYFHNDARFDYICRRQVKEARGRLERNKQAITRSRMVAALSFGFWVTLLGRGGMLSAKGAKANYEMTLWRPSLHKAFPNRPGLARKQAYQPLDYLRTFRNRIAHHEAIFERDLRRDYNKIMRVTGWISPEARVWIEEHSRVPDLLVAREDIRMKF